MQIEIHYTACCVDGQLLNMVATGTFPTAGWSYQFRKKDEDFEFVVTPPDGVAAQVLTPFIACGYIAVENCPRSITIHDENGVHQVHVASVPKVDDHTVGNP